MKHPKAECTMYLVDTVPVFGMKNCFRLTIKVQAFFSCFIYLLKVFWSHLLDVLSLKAMCKLPSR